MHDQGKQLMTEQMHAWECSNTMDCHWHNRISVERNGQAHMKLGMTLTVEGLEASCILHGKQADVDELSCYLSA